MQWLYLIGNYCTKDEAKPIYDDEVDQTIAKVFKTRFVTAVGVLDA